MKRNCLYRKIEKFSFTLVCLLASANLYADIKVEVFIDADKGYETGTVVTGIAGDNEIIVPLENVTSGVHLISFRTKDDTGKWSTTITRPIYIYDADGFDGAEYYIDKDPGTGNGKLLNISEQGNISFIVPTESLEIGPHTLTVRLRSGSTWMASMTKSFVVTPNSVLFEWFFDEDPGVGNANQKEANIGNNVFLLPVADITPGAHTFSFRTRDAANRWSTTCVRPLFVTEKIDDLSYLEYFIDQDPGRGNGEEIGLSPDNESSFFINTESLSEGSHQFNLRAKDNSGRWLDLYSAPFKILVQSGVKDINWKSTVNISRNNDAIIISSDSLKPGSRIDIVDVNGMILHTSEWSDGESVKNIGLNTNGHYVIVVITDTDGFKYSKLLH